MRVVLLSPEYGPAPARGGIGTNTETLGRALAGRGHEVHIITRGEGTVTYEEDGVTIERLRHRWVPSPKAQLVTDRFTIQAAVRRARPDIVHSAEWNAEAWWIARFSNVPLISRLATPTYLVEELNHGSVQSDTALLRAMERDQVRRSDAIYAPTAAIADRVSEDWGLARGAIRVIPNSIDVARVAGMASGPCPRELPANYAVFIGRLERRKGLEVLGPALAESLREVPDLHAVLIGRDPGAEEGALMRRFREATSEVADRIHILGELPQSEAFPIVARASFAVLPSLWEAFGYVCVEAMAAGTPVIASRVGGFAEIVSEGSGWLVRPGDADELAARIAAVAQDTDGIERAALASRRRARDFDVAEITRRVESLLEDAVESKAGFAPDVYERGYGRYFKADDQGDPFHSLYEAKARSVVTALARRRPQLILDVGGGYGRIASRIDGSHQVLLCDISREMLALARERTDHLVLVQGDARSLPFPDEAFDTVIALDLLVHLREWATGLAELARVVRPRGQLIFDTTNASPWWVLRYPSYAGFRPKRLLLTMLSGGVLPEWRGTVTHQRVDDVPRAADAAGLVLDDLRSFGPALCPKWHLWFATRRDRS